MAGTTLTLQGAQIRAVLVPLSRPIVSSVGRFDHWPLILIDLHTREGVVGHSDLEPYLVSAVPAIVTMLRALVERQVGHRVCPLADFQGLRKSLNLVGDEGLTMIAVSGLDMAAWDALAKASGQPLAELLGGDDLAAIREVRSGAGSAIELMVDFNQGLNLGDALRRCHALDGEGLYWFEEPIVYDNLAGYAQLTRELRTPVQRGENFDGPRDVLHALEAGAGDYVMPDLMRIGGVSGWLRATGLRDRVQRGRGGALRAGCLM